VVAAYSTFDVQATMGLRIALIQMFPSFHNYLILRSKLFGLQRMVVNLYARMDKLAS
jgi:hypothetical protein